MHQLAAARYQVPATSQSSYISASCHDSTLRGHSQRQHASHSCRTVSSLNLAGFTGEPVAADPERLLLSWARNGWATEFRWQHHTLEQAGIVDPSPLGGPRHDSSRCHVGVASFGSWSTGNFLAVGAVTDQRTGHCWTWQIEHNGAWQWQAFDINSSLALTLSGPTSAEHFWSLRLGPGERFSSVPATLAVSPGGLEGALAEMTRHRRLTRRPNRDNRECPVIFNYYMNCLMGDPTTEKLRPLVRAAAEAGCEYFVIDCGWYADNAGWWDTVGDWEPAASRFPRGLGEVTDAITAAGMTPGLWLEPEVVGVRSAVAARFSSEAYFCRDGRPIIENGRYQLDFTHPEVTRHLDDTVDRLIGQFGIGYLKLDYNINIGHGTDTRGRSPGAGLLDHNRAYSRWLDTLFPAIPGWSWRTAPRGECAPTMPSCHGSVCNQPATRSTRSCTPRSRHRPPPQSPPSRLRSGPTRSRTGATT